MPSKVGLYNPAYEHDACGVAMVVDMHGRRSRDIVDHAITALVNLEHRGAAGADASTGDGAGILIQMPDLFFQQEAGFDLPSAGEYGVGMCFLPRDPDSCERLKAGITAIAEREGQTVLGWRDVPVDTEHVGRAADRSRRAGHRERPGRRRLRRMGRRQWRSGASMGPPARADGG